MTTFYPPSLSGQLFAQSLANAYRSGVRLYDPSIALREDAEAYETILRHGVIAQAFDRRKTLVAGLTWSVEPASDDEGDKRLAVIQERLLRNIRGFREARKHLAGACVYGTSFGYVHWVEKFLDIGDGKFRAWDVPVRIEAIDRRLFRGVPRTVDDERNGRRLKRIRVEWEKFDEATARWVVIDDCDKPNYVRHAFDDGPDRLGHGRGLIDAVKFLWYFRAALWEELLNGAEFWSRGFIEILVKNMREGTKTNPQIVTDYVEQVERHRSRHVFVHDADDEAKITQGGGEGSQLCLEAIKAIDSEIRSLINHANLNTSANSGGSYALADTQQDSETMGTIQPDRESLAETLTVSIVQGGFDRNRANLFELGLMGAESGRFSIANQTIDDPKITAEVFQTMLASGAAIPKRIYYERLGVPMPADGEEVIAATAPQQASPFAFPMPGFGAPSPLPPKE